MGFCFHTQSLLFQCLCKFSKPHTKCRQYDCECEQTSTDAMFSTWVVHFGGQNFCGWQLLPHATQTKTATRQHKSEMNTSIVFVCFPSCVLSFTTWFSSCLQCDCRQSCVCGGVQKNIVTIMAHGLWVHIPYPHVELTRFENSGSRDWYDGAFCRGATKPTCSKMSLQSRGQVAV